MCKPYSDSVFVCPIQVCICFFCSCNIFTFSVVLYTQLNTVTLLNPSSTVTESLVHGYESPIGGINCHWLGIAPVYIDPVYIYSAYLYPAYNKYQEIIWEVKVEVLAEVLFTVFSLLTVYWPQFYVLYFHIFHPYRSWLAVQEQVRLIFNDDCT